MADEAPHHPHFQVTATIIENGKTKGFDAIIHGPDLEDGIREVRAAVGRNPTSITILESIEVDERGVPLDENGDPIE